jgi:hypothetical protein
MQQCIKILLFLVLNGAQHVSGDTPPIIRSLKLHKQPLVFHTWKVVGRCQIACTTWQRPATPRPTTFHLCKTRGCLCSFRLLMMGGVSPETCWASCKIRNNKISYPVASCWVSLCKNYTCIYKKHTHTRTNCKLHMQFSLTAIWKTLNKFGTYFSPCNVKCLSCWAKLYADVFVATSKSSEFRLAPSH